VPGDVRARKRRVDRPVADVLKAQERYAKAEVQLDRAREARDVAICNASAAGFTRRSIAHATGLTPGRVQQIVEQARKAK
jgi:hypothetical protein